MSFPWPPGAATGIGSLPGTDPDEAVRLVLGEAGELPYLPELPGRGFGADMIARTGSLLVDFPLEWQPHGWTVAGRPGRDLARARDHLRRDLDAVTEQAQGVPLLKVSVCGPLTLGASLELPNLHKVLTDHGAFRDLTGSLVEGTRTLLADLGGRLPGTAIVLQVDEPGLPQVLAGEVPTPSGYGTVRSLPRSVAQPALAELLELAAPGHRVVHCCAARVPYDLLAGAGASAVSVDASLLTDASLDALGELVEAGVSLWLGVFPGTDTPISAAEARERIGRLWAKLGFGADRLAGAVVPTPACGLAGASLPYARRVMAQLREVGAALRDGLE
ncbi:methionine synthase [Jatrophihabitans sp.]|uniref:methionine synthase n=1 Tax=Jatrophihabitans sp. TaxID=1932789 RepID=UPI002BAD2454|nr:methionine synthase [Jatrophihabitans sp.]